MNYVWTSTVTDKKNVNCISFPSDCFFKGCIKIMYEFDLQRCFDLQIWGKTKLKIWWFRNRDMIICFIKKSMILSYVETLKHKIWVLLIDIYIDISKDIVWFEYIIIFLTKKTYLFIISSTNSM